MLEAHMASIIDLQGRNSGHGIMSCLRRKTESKDSKTPRKKGWKNKIKRIYYWFNVLKNKDRYFQFR